CWRSPQSCARRLPDQRSGEVPRICSSHVLSSDVPADASIVDLGAAVASRSAARHLRRQFAAGLPHLVFPCLVSTLAALLGTIGFSDLRLDRAPGPLESRARLREAAGRAVGADASM